MGTRAQFFINNPEDLGARKWLGCVAWDGYPDGDCRVLADCASEAAFIEAVGKLARERRDFCDPAVHGFPFPWSDDLFLTDFTYAWMDGRVMLANYHTGWMPLGDYLHQGEAARNAFYERGDTLPGDVAAPTKWDRSAPGGIIIVRGS